MLTGAGFSKDFGGLLAREIRDELLNQSLVVRDNGLYGLLTGKMTGNPDGNYELALSRLESKTGRELKRELFLKGLLTVFSEMDLSMISRLGVNKSTYSMTLTNALHFIHSWLTADGACGDGHYFFTLNQDVLVERYWSLPLKHHADYFGIRQIGNPIGATKSLFHERISRPVMDLEMKIEQDLGEVFASRLYYVKLHGSMNWMKNDGSRVMISGANKEGKISTEPLLAGLWNCFESQCSKEGVKILCIGYGFGDSHVNNVLSEALAKKNAELVIVSPSAWESRKKMTDSAAKRMQNLTIEQIGDLRSRIRHYEGGMLDHFFVSRSQYCLYGRLAKEINSCAT